MSADDQTPDSAAPDGSSRSDALDRREGEIEQRRAAVDKLYQQACDFHAQAQQKQQQLAALKQTYEQRDAELRNESLKLALERDRIAQERRAIQATDPPRPPEQAEHATSSRTQKRGPTIATMLLLSSATGVGAGALVYWVEPAEYRGAVVTTIESDRADAEQITAEYAAALLADDPFSDAWADHSAKQAWRAARAEGRVRIEPDAATSTVGITISGTPAGAVLSLLSEVERAARISLAELADDETRSPRHDAWNGVRQSIVSEIEAARVRRASLEELDPSSEPSETSAGNDRMEAARERLEQVEQSWRSRRDEYATLESQTTPTVTVTEEQLARGSDTDRMYQQDLAELGARVREYRAELLLATERMPDALRTLHAQLDALIAKLIEQRDLRPPTESRRVIEECLNECRESVAPILTAAGDALRLRRSAEQVQPPDGAASLLQLQSELQRLGDGQLRNIRSVLERVRKQLDTLTSGPNVGTRDLVVAAELRAALSAVADALPALAIVARSVDVEHNIRLDAIDRQLRSLTRRLAQRRDALRRRLEDAASQAAIAGRETALRDLREQISALEQDRLTALDELFEVLTQLRRSDHGALAGREQVGVLREIDARIVRLEQRLATHATSAPQNRTDTITVSRTPFEDIGSRVRLRLAGITAAGVWLMTAIGCLLSFRPIRGASRRLRS